MRMLFLIETHSFVALLFTKFLLRFIGFVSEKSQIVRRISFLGLFASEIAFFLQEIESVVIIAWLVTTPLILALILVKIAIIVIEVGAIVAKIVPVVVIIVVEPKLVVIVAKTAVPEIIALTLVHISARTGLGKRVEREIVILLRLREKTILRRIGRRPIVLVLSHTVVICSPVEVLVRVEVPEVHLVTGVLCGWIVADLRTTKIIPGAAGISRISLRLRDRRLQAEIRIKHAVLLTHIIILIATDSTHVELETHLFILWRVEPAVKIHS